MTQRVFTEDVGQFRRGDCPDNPQWWWDGYMEVSLPIRDVVLAGLDAMRRQQRKRAVSR